MDDLRIRITVDESGRMRPTRRDTNARGPESQLTGAGLDLDVLRLFEGWLRLRDRRWRESEIRIIGSLLHRYLFGERDSWDWVDGVMREVHPAVVHLELVFPADTEFARLAGLPWEYLYRPETPGRTGAFLATERNLVLSRFIPSSEGLPPLPEKDRLHVLVVVSRPKDALLGEVLYEEVLAQIEQTVAALDWKCEFFDEPTAQGLHDKVFANTVPDLVHFMGHGQFDSGRGEGSLALIGPNGGTQWVPDRQLAAIMTRGAQTPRAVVLHACEGGVADFPLSFAGVATQLVRNRVPNVVAMQYAVTNETAIEFSTSLYHSISDGDDLDVAVQNARWKIMAFGEDPRLLGLPVVYRQGVGALFARGGRR